MSNILDFSYYCPRVLKIKTKIHGIQPFILRDYQKKYLQWRTDSFPTGIIRAIILKPRQSGFSTLEAGINIHRTITRHNERGIVMADKFGRTSELQSIYSNYITHIPDKIKPMIAKDNSDEVLFDNPNRELRNAKPGLGSGFKYETAQDANAGRAGTRNWAHLSEFAFFPHAMETDEGLGNSIPLARGTSIVKESTANGMSGDGEAFYNLWCAAEEGSSIYRPFFVPWQSIPDYAIEVPRGFILTKEEIDLVKRCPDITNANLVWRRLKISEYSKTSDSPLEPVERFKQDFPSYPSEAFLSTGRPVFDMESLKNDIEDLRNHPPKKHQVKIKQTFLAMYPRLLTVYFVPENGMKYSIGADVSLGLDIGDASHAKILDSNMREVAHFHGQLDPDHFGRCLVELARTYNNAIIVPEINAMGHTTLNAIKDMGYTRVYNREVNDELDEHKITSKIGWQTNVKTKQVMLNALIAAYRDKEVTILDDGTLKEMLRCTRESDGSVELNGKDRVVATCLALQGFNQIYESATVYNPGKPKKLIFETMDKSREEIAKLDKKKKSVFSLEDY